MQQFFASRARFEASRAVKEIEAFSSAEIVVTLRRRSGDYRHTDYLWGFILSQAALLALLYLPQRFAVGLFVVHCTLWFVAGALLSSRVPAVQRLLTSRRRFRATVSQAARASFMALGVDETRRRTGLLVYLSAHERTVALVRDRGIPDALGPIWDQAEQALQAAFGRGDLEATLAALRTLGPPLAQALPRRRDDINELPDEVRVA